jgi:hypothetical protein
MRRQRWTAESRFWKWTTMFWPPERDPTARADRDIRERHASAIALRDASHNRDRRGFLPEQHERWLQYIAAINGELSFERAAFWKWLVENGRVNR